MSRLLKRILPILFAVFFVFSTVSVSPYAAECTDKPEAIRFSFLNADSSANISAECYYSDEYFYSSGMQTDTHLRTLSLCMAMSAFESFREGEDYENRCENLEALLLEMGFSDLFHNEAYDQKPTEDSIGIAIGSKKIDVFGIEYTLIAVGIRGASYGAEWASNMLVGESGHAKGFSSACEQVLSAIREYETAHGITDHAKIWISGFSRAGAVANLAGNALNRLPLDYATTKDDIYCYTFEAPQGADKNIVGQYSNIHNTVSTADLVPLLPFAQWGLTRVGYPQEGQPDPYSQDDLLLLSPQAGEYIANIDIMLDHLAQINPYIQYAIEDFSEVRFSLGSIGSKTTRTQSEFVADFSQWITSTLPEQTRASYAANYEESFSTFSRIMLSAPVQKTSAALTALVKDPGFYGHLLSTVVVIQTRNLRNEESYEESLRECGRNLGEKLVKHMIDAQIDLSEEESEALIRTVYPIIHFLDAAIEDDVKNYNGYHLATLLSNLNSLFQAHCPEVILAWLETYDSYYTPSRFVEHKLEYEEEKEATCTRNGHSAYWICSVCEATYADSKGLERIPYGSTLLPATGHRWDDGVVTKEPTETSTGVRTYTCLNCGEQRTEEIAKLPPKPKETKAVTKTPRPTVTESEKEPVREESSPAESSKEENRTANTVRFLVLTLCLICAIILAIFLVRYRKKEK